MVYIIIVKDFDTGKKPSEAKEPERFYHGFVLGLIVDLEDRYQITSNLESGFGRYDVVVESKEKADPGRRIKTREMKEYNRLLFHAGKN